jgi:flagellar operon protein
VPEGQIPLPVGSGPGLPRTEGTARPAGARGPARDFARILDAQLDQDLRFSKHARARLASRDIPLSQDQYGRLARATQEAEKRGAREALLLMGNVGFIVSVPNRTVITALDGERMEAGVITGIDAAVVVPSE